MRLMRDNIVKKINTPERIIMNISNNKQKTSRLAMQMMRYDLPPSGEALICGKRCHIGTNAAKRMLDAVAPGQFEYITVENDDVIESIFFKKILLTMADKDSLTAAILEEAKPIMSPSCMISVKCDITVCVAREI